MSNLETRNGLALLKTQINPNVLVPFLQRVRAPVCDGVFCYWSRSVSVFFLSGHPSSGSLVVTWSFLVTWPWRRRRRWRFSHKTKPTVSLAIFEAVLVLYATRWLRANGTSDLSITSSGQSSVVASSHSVRFDLDRSSDLITTCRLISIRKYNRTSTVLVPHNLT